MPSIARAIGLIFVFAAPACLAAQTIFPDDSRYHPADMPPGADPPVFRTPGTLASLPRHVPGDVVPVAFESPLAAGQRPTSTDEPLASEDAAVGAVPLAPRPPQPSLPLAPPGRSRRAQEDRNSGLPSVITVVGSLAVVLGIFFLIAWGMRRAAPPGAIALPSEVFEVLGRASMTGRQQVHLLRCGRKLVLVSVTPAGAETLTEITDPVEVDRLAGLCHQGRPNSATAAFRQVFGQFAPPRLRWGSLREVPADGDYDDLRLAGTGVLRADEGLEDRDV